MADVVDKVAEVVQRVAKVETPVVRGRKVKRDILEESIIDSPPPKKHK